MDPGGCISEGFLYGRFSCRVRSVGVRDSLVRDLGRDEFLFRSL